MKKTYEWTGPTGNKFRIDANCTASLKPVSRLYDACDVRHFTDKMEIVYDAQLDAYVNGQKTSTCSNVDAWKVVELPGRPDCKKIRGLDRIAFTNDKADEIRDFLNAAIIEGTPADVAKFMADEAAAEQARVNARTIRECKKIISAFEAQTKSPETRSDARRMMDEYNRANNEGGEGYVPRIYNREDYDRAMSELSALERN